MPDLLRTIGSSLAVAIGGTLVAWYFARVKSGRFSRTLDESGKVVEFVEHWCKVSADVQNVASAGKANVERLMAQLVTAVQDDLSAERSTLDEFHTSAGRWRRLLLLRVPKRPILWIPQLLFHTALLLPLIVIFARTYPKEPVAWGEGDAVVVVSSLALAVIFRQAAKPAA